MMNSKILLVVEGADDEKKFLDHCLKALQLNINYKIFRYGCNLYDFYQRLRDNAPDDDFSDLDILTVLREANRLPLEEDRDVLTQEYSEIFLVFDLDNHDPKHSTQEKRAILNHLSKFFVEATDLGLLIVNTPMVEAYRDVSLSYDEVRLNPPLDATLGRRYKELVDRRGLKMALKSFSKDSFLVLSRLNFQAVCSLLSLKIESQSFWSFKVTDFVNAVYAFEDTSGTIPVVAWISLLPFYFNSSLIDRALKTPLSSGMHFKK